VWGGGGTARNNLPVNTHTHARARAHTHTHCTLAICSTIGINMSPYAEVSGCNIGGTDGAMSNGRCIWCLATSRALVHHNHVHHCTAHALDFDAYTSSSVAYSNLCEMNGEQGIFVEETASGNFVFNNT
jgi:hypothetical protein